MFSLDSAGYAGARLGDEGVEAFRVVVGALACGASAGEVEAFADAVGPLAGVGLAGEVEGQSGRVGWPCGRRS